MNRSILRIATRASNLALWQANFVADLLRSLDPGLQVELVHVTTTGDRLGEASLSGLGGVGVFTREIQHALLDGRADVAVHSLKDLPTEPVDGICLAAVPKRASPWDALVLPRGSSSPLVESVTCPPVPGSAREASAGALSFSICGPIFNFSTSAATSRPGSANSTRVRSTRIILAEAGLDRLGLSTRISARLAPPDLFPAVGQGALGLECRSNDATVRPIVERLSHPPTWSAVTAERRTLARLGAGCHAPVGVSTTVGRR